MPVSKVIARYVDGRVVKGHTTDFRPDSERFHLYPPEAGLSGPPQEIEVADLKAVFVVKAFEGRPDYAENKEFPEPPTHGGRKVRVEFTDGEVLVGYCYGNDPQRPGFFIFPADPESNNNRVYVVYRAAAHFKYLEV